MKKLLIYIPPILLFVQIVNTFFSDYLSYPRALILILIVLYAFLTRRYKFDSISKILIIFLIYTFIISLRSSNLIVSISGYLSIFVSMSFYIISYNTINSSKEFYEFRKWLFWISLLFILNVVIFAGLGLGTSVYGGKGVLRTGEGLHHNTIYTGVLVIILSYEFLKTINNKILYVILITAVIIIILLTFRRTAIILMILSYLLYIFMGQKKNVIKYVTSIVLILLIASPLYLAPLMNVIEARGARATFKYGIENTSRFLETKVITEKNIESSDLVYQLFGMEYLNSFGTYGTKSFEVKPGRILHTDYAVILHGCGIIGLLLYFTFMLLTLVKAFRTIKYIGAGNSLSIFLMSLSIILIAVTFSGSLLSITFRTTFFILLGALNSLSDKEISKINFKKKSYKYGRILKNDSIFIKSPTSYNRCNIN